MTEKAEKAFELFKKYNPEYFLKNSFSELLLNLTSILPFEKRKIKYIDTDSQFISIPEANEQVVSNYEKIYQMACLVYDIAKNSSNYEPDDKDNYILRYSFKNEFQTDVIIFYGKKSYIGVNVETGETVITGVEGKKGTYRIIENLLEDFIDELKKFVEEKVEFDYYQAFEFVLRFIRKYFKEIEKRIEIWDSGDKNLLPGVVEDLGLPINISKTLDELKVVSSFYRGTVAFDIVEGNYYSSGKASKSKYLFIEPRSEKLRLELIERLSKYVKNLDEVKDLTIPEEFLSNYEMLDKLRKNYAINKKYYLKILIKKILRLLKPFLSKWHLRYLEVLADFKKMEQFYNLFPGLVVNDNFVVLDWKNKRFLKDKYLNPNKFTPKDWNSMKKAVKGEKYQKEFESLLEEKAKEFFKRINPDVLQRFKTYRISFKKLSEYSEEFRDFIKQDFSEVEKVIKKGIVEGKV